MPGAARGIACLRAAGFELAVVTNQPAASKGKASLVDLDAVATRARELLAAAGAPVEHWYTCLHHPSGVVPELTCDCDCRKPAPGMLLQAAVDLDLDLSKSWMIGDSDGDMLAGRAVGARTVLIEHAGSAHRRSGLLTVDLVAADLEHAAARIATSAAGCLR